LLVSWCAGGRCGMACSDEDRGRSRRPGAEDREWLHRSGTRWSGDQEVGWRHVRSAVCEWFGLKTTRMVFVGLASKPVVTVFGGLVSKLAVTVFSGLASKPVATVSDGLASKPTVTVFSGLASNLALTVWPQNLLWQFFGLGLKTDSCDLMIWTSNSPRRFLGLDLKTKQTSVYRLRHKTDEGRSARGTCRDLAA
jgi:hypothetical protein